MTSSGIMQYVHSSNDSTASTFFHCQVPPTLCVWTCHSMKCLMPIEFCLRNRWITGEDPQGGHAPPWIQNVCNDLSSFGMELAEAREAAQNRPFWQMLMKHSTTYLYWCTLVLDYIVFCTVDVIILIRAMC